MSKPLTFGSLFAGIGGMDLGLERAGMVCKWQVEIDDYATRVLERHWPDVRRWRDVRTFPPDAESTREHDCIVRKTDIKCNSKKVSEWQVDLVAAGFPCQDISYAGKGAGLAGERSGLFYEVARIVRILGPRYVLLENVAALLTRGLDAVLGTLASLGYDAQWHCIPAAAVGAPHIRDRVFVIAEHSDTKRLKRNSERKTSKSNSGHREAFKEKRRRRVSDEVRGICSSISDTNIQRLPQRQGKDAAGAWANCWTQPARDSWWDAEPDVGRVAHGIPARVHRLRGLGNAVVPQVAEYIGRQIVRFAHE